MEHRVLAHLGLAARDYDVAIRRYIPGYEQMVDTIVRLVARRTSSYVIDLGAGTGALGGGNAGRVPTARVPLLDIDPPTPEGAGAGGPGPWGAALGIPLAGAAYLPLDRSHPRERIEFALRDARAVAFCGRFSDWKMLHQR